MDWKAILMCFHLVSLKQYPWLDCNIKTNVSFVIVVICCGLLWSVVVIVVQCKREYPYGFHTQVCIRIVYNRKLCS